MASPSPPRHILTPGEVSTLKLGICLDCGSEHLLRGPSETHYTDWTCGDCQMGFRIIDGIMSIRLGPNSARAAFYDPKCPEKVCMREECGKTFTGPSFYCCIGCTIEDA